MAFPNFTWVYDVGITYYPAPHDEEQETTHEHIYVIANSLTEANDIAEEYAANNPFAGFFTVDAVVLQFEAISGVEPENDNWDEDAPEIETEVGEKPAE